MTVAAATKDPTEFPQAMPTAVMTLHATAEAPASAGHKVSPVLAKKATTYRWMWADAGKTFFGHTWAAMNPLRWSIWAGPDNTISHLEKYKQGGDDRRPVEMEVGPPPIRTLKFSDVSEAIEYVNSYRAGRAPIVTGPPYPEEHSEPSSSPSQEHSYPPGMFLAVGGSGVEMKAAAGAVEVVSRRSKWPRTLARILLPFLGLGTIFAVLRRRATALGQALGDEEAPLNGDGA